MVAMIDRQQRIEGLTTPVRACLARRSARCHQQKINSTRTRDQEQDPSTPRHGMVWLPGGGRCCGHARELVYRVRADLTQRWAPARSPPWPFRSCATANRPHRTRHRRHSSHSPQSGDLAAAAAARRRPQSTIVRGLRLVGSMAVTYGDAVRRPTWTRKCEGTRACQGNDVSQGKQTIDLPIGRD